MIQEVIQQCTMISPFKRVYSYRGVKKRTTSKELWLRSHQPCLFKSLTHLHHPLKTHGNEVLLSNWLLHFSFRALHTHIVVFFQGRSQAGYRLGYDERLSKLVHHRTLQQNQEKWCFNQSVFRSDNSIQNGKSDSYIENSITSKKFVLSLDFPTVVR